MKVESAVIPHCTQRIYRNRIAYKIQCNLINQSVSSHSTIFTGSRSRFLSVLFLFGSQIEYLRTSRPLAHQYIGEVVQAFFVRNISMTLMY
jgi:hypothetical protein